MICFAKLEKILILQKQNVVNCNNKCAKCHELLLITKFNWFIAKLLLHLHLKFTIYYMMTEKKKPSNLIFEISWEVCNKVGGIYTVLSTKAKTMNSLFQDQVIFIGPDFGKENTSSTFIESPRLLSAWKKNGNLPQDIKVRVGRWDIPGRPTVILVDYKELYSYKNELYSKMWDKYKVDSLHAYGDYDESCMFAYGAALVVESYSKFISQKESINLYAHFDEWTTGMGLLYLKDAMPNIATIFTTHATSIGRSICGNNKPLYDYMSGYNGDQMADELNMQSKHSLEKTAAHVADAFTTVSDVTAVECKQLIGREAIVTPNGFELNFVPAKSQFKKKREAARKKLIEVAQSLIGVELSDDTLIIGTSGRNEFRNKGLDAFIDSINVLRDKWSDSSKHVVAFMMVPAWVKEARIDLINKLNGSEEKLSNKNISHEINNYNDDAIYGKMRYLNLNNEDNGNVHIIYVPCYLNGNDGIFNMDYYDLLIGFDCTLFASYYEPWGYTPMESVAFSVPTITTDLSGFGQWVLTEHGDGFETSGVKVIHRTDSNYSEVVDQISNSLYSFLVEDSNNIEKARQKAKQTADSATWENFMKHYEVAYNQAINNIKNL